MGIYTDSVRDHNNGYGSSPFHTTLTTCLLGVVRSLDNLAALNLAENEEPKSLENGHIRNHNSWATDVMIFYAGVPIVAVATCVEGSTRNRNLARKIGKASLGNATRVIQEKSISIGAKLQAAEASKIPPKEADDQNEADPYLIMTELKWRIVLRMPSTEMGVAPGTLNEYSFEGGPFNFDIIEAAFDKLTDILVTAIKATPHIPHAPSIAGDVPSER